MRPPNTPGPFGMADADAARDVLAHSGFERIEARKVDGVVVLGNDPGDAFDFVCRMGMTLALLDGLDAHTKERALGDLRDVLAKKQGPKGVSLSGSAWSFVARRT